MVWGFSPSPSSLLHWHLEKSRRAPHQDPLPAPEETGPRRPPARRRRVRLRGDGAALHTVTAVDEQDPSTPAADPNVRWLVLPAHFLRVPSPALNEGISVPTPLWTVTRVTSRGWTRPLGSTFVGKDTTAQGAEWHVGVGTGFERRSRL